MYGVSVIIYLMKVSNSSRLEHHLTQLVSHPSVSGDIEANKSIIDYCLTELGKTVDSVDVISINGVPALYASTRNTRKPKLLLQAHLDVVPADPAAFALKEKDGKYLGRGVFDMKFAAACYLTLAEELAGTLQDYDFGIMLTCDEEIGGDNGVGYLLDNGYSADVCLLPDGGDEWRVEATCNAVWLIRLTSQGVTAHGSRPWEGQNAIASLVKALNEIQSVFGELKRGRNSITISQIHGGTAINQVPESAEATVDMRFLDAEQHEAFKQTVKAIIDNHKLGIDVIADTTAGNIDMKNPRVIDFLLVAERIHGQPLGTTHSLGASDGRFFAEKNIPAIIVRPHGGGHHSAIEWIDKIELHKFYEVIKAYVTETTKVA